jgi:hypothetical protein
MDLELLHKMCKEDTRNAFNEFKRISNIQLFRFNNNVKQDMQKELAQGLCSRTVKYFIMNYNLSDLQIQFLCKTTNCYNKLVFNVSDNYSKKF